MLNCFSFIIRTHEDLSLTDRKANWLSAVVLFIASAAVYLPFVSRIGLMNDDWYLMVAGKAGGAGIFSSVFASDRPMRALVMGAAYFLFGDQIVLYHLSGYFFRLLSGTCTYWLFQMIWPENRSSNLCIAVLFTIYPGFLSQVNPIDYQSQLFALFLAVLSIALTVYATSLSGWLKGLLILLSILTGIFYLGLVEYFLGFEALRVFCLFLLNYKSNLDSIGSAARTTIKQWLPSAIIPFVFMFWRIFIFESERKATDLGTQMEAFVESPLMNGFWSVWHLLQDSLSAAFLAWGVPFYQALGDLRLRDQALGLTIATVVIVGILLSLRYLDTRTDSRPEDSNWQVSAIIIGMVSVVISLLPVILVNRRLSFEYYSRYALAAALGSAMILAGSLYLITSRRVRFFLLALLVFTASMTHFYNSAYAAARTVSMNDFWWQVSWRVPAFQPETTLIVNYAVIPVEEDYFVWGPATLAYHGEAITGDKVTPKVYGVVLTNDYLLSILYGGEGLRYERRGIVTNPNLGNILILSQHASFSCVHVIDANAPVISTYERPEFKSAAPYSDVSLVDTNTEPTNPPAAIFGTEPEHGWCYIFQQASLASQRGEWEVVVQLGDNAWKQDLHPEDKSEWLVFLDAYARLDQANEVAKIAKDFKKDGFQSYMYCQRLKDSITENTFSVSMRDFLRDTFCGFE